MTTSSTRAAKLCALFFTTALASPALAQTVPAPPPPVFMNLDDNGVDLARGTYVLSFVEGSIGSGDAELALVRRGYDRTQPHEWDRMSLGKSVVGSTETVWVSTGSTSVMFTNSGSGFVDVNASGATLVQGGGSYTFTTRDGLGIQFGDPTGHWNGGETNFCKGYDETNCTSLPLSVSYPNGRSVNFEWLTHGLCDEVWSATIACSFSWRLSRVWNSAGYGVGFSYAADEVPAWQPPSYEWRTRTGAAFYNGTVSPYTPQSSTSYSYPSTGASDVVDTGGRSWRFSGVDTYRVTGIRRPGASSDTTTIAYGSSGVSSVTRDGVTTGYSRVVSGTTATMTVTNALSQQTVIVSNLTTGRPTEVIAPSPANPSATATTSYQYDSSGRLTRVTEPEGNYVQYTLDARGNVTQSQRFPKSGSTTIVTSATFEDPCASPSCNQPLTTTDERGQVTEYDYDDTHGGLLWVKAPAPSVGAARPETRYTWTVINGAYQMTAVSACQTLSSCVGTADEVKSSVVYDAQGNVTSVSTGNGSGTLTATQAMTYDAVGNLLTVDGPLAGTGDTTRLRYNGARQVVGTISPDPDGSGALKHRAVRNSYTNGLATKVEIGTVNSQSDSDWAAFAPAQAADTTYNANARPSVRSLVSGSTIYQLSQVSYDALGRPECTALRMNPAAWSSLPASACSLGTQGGDGPDRIVRTFYGGSGHVVKTTSAYGTVEASDDVVATYSTNGLVASATDAQGNRTSYEYDGHDRLVKTFYPVAAVGMQASNANDYEQLTYETLTGGTRTSGLVTSRRLRDGQSINHGYDSLGRLTSKDRPNAVWWETDISYGYDLLGRPTVATDSNGHSLTFGYDALGRRTSEGSNWYGAMTSAYDLAGRRVSLTWPDAFYVTYDHLVTGEMTAIREYGAASGAGVLATFGYDDLGQRTSLTRGNGTVTSYGHDAVSRLSSLGQVLPGGTVSMTFGYNPAGQIASTTRDNDAYAWTGHANVDRGYSVNGLNQLTSAGATNLGYDSRGNLITSGASSYSYTADNQLATSPGSGYGYDPLGRLFHESVAVSAMLYEGTNMVMERDSSTGDIRRRYVFGPGIDEPLVWYEGAGTNDRRWLHADERGSIVAVTNGAGAATNINIYDEYGIPGVNNVGRFQYTGQMWLPELGMYHYKARTYSPSLGRFMQTDPIGYEDGANWYNYVGGDPVNFNDPSGLCMESQRRSGGDCGAREQARKFVEKHFGKGAGSRSLEDAVTAYLEGKLRFSSLQDIAGRITSGDIVVFSYRGADYSLNDIGDVVGNGAAFAFDTVSNFFTPAACCFAAGTAVLTPRGYEEIESLRAGDLVVSRNIKTGETVTKPIVDVTPAHKRRIWRVKIEYRLPDGSAKNETIETTKEHPWRSQSEVWLETSDLKAGDVLVRHSGWATVADVSETDLEKVTYNLEVAEFHTYFVGSSGTWVHNSCWSYQPSSLQEELAMKAARKGYGRIVPIVLNDPRYKGMVKMEYVVRARSGIYTTVHYVRNPVNGAIFDVKVMSTRF